jgi:hypothetical protein
MINNPLQQNIMTDVPETTETVFLELFQEGQGRRL